LEIVCIQINIDGQFVLVLVNVGVALKPQPESLGIV